MNTKFFIDKQFGSATWLEVEDGIIRDFTGNDTFTNKLREEYKGKEVSYFKEHFENRMKPAWYCVKSFSYIELKHVRNGILNRLSHLNNRLTNIDTIEADKDEIRENINKVNEELYENTLNLNAEAKNLLESHKFIVPILK